MLTRNRITLNFWMYPTSRRKNRLMASWVLDVFKDASNETVAVRCYKTSQHGCESRLQDGWLARSKEAIETKRQEVGKIIASRYITQEREAPSDHDGGKTIHTITDIRL